MTVTAEVVDVEVTAMEAVTAGVTVPGLAPVVVETDPAAVAAGTDLIHHLHASAGALPVSFMLFYLRLLGRVIKLFIDLLCKV